MFRSSESGDGQPARTGKRRRVRTPTWDGEKLWWGRELIREFGKRKSAQKVVLGEFKRRHWTKKDVDFTSILHQLKIEGRRATQWIEDTVHNLNHGLRRIRFHMDSKQRLIWWHVVGK